MLEYKRGKEVVLVPIHVLNSGDIAFPEQASVLSRLIYELVVAAQVLSRVILGLLFISFFAKLLAVIQFVVWLLS